MTNHKNTYIDDWKESFTPLVNLTENVNNIIIVMRSC